MVKRILMIAGPNGAGKTTTALTLLPRLPLIYEFVNADEIAKGLAPLHPETMALTASKLMIQRIRALLSNGKNFAFESTAAGTNYVKHLRQAKERGYEISLLFLFLIEPALAVQRVAERVEQGGHFVPEDTIRRRYFGGIKNLLQCYLPLADRAYILDNSAKDHHIVVAHKAADASLKIKVQATWTKMEKIANDGIRRS